MRMVVVEERAVAPIGEDHERMHHERRETSLDPVESMEFFALSMDSPGSFVLES